ncbi:hypothetical protein MMC22_000955 [Lobaria immixta]|nr:hypothetical protein [Lobaria immixta]
MTGSEGITSGSRDLVAVSIGRDLELLPPFSGSPRNLPNEVLLMIFKLLDKNHLKSVRCGCKLLELLVSPLLFDKVYISPHRPNLDVFRQITEHSGLCRYPRELVYDVQKFKPNINLKEYFDSLCGQLRALIRGSSVHLVDQELESLVTAIKDCVTRESHTKSRVVQRGLELYRERAEEQDHNKNSGQLLARLCIGLMRLPYLDKIMFQSTWDDRHLQSVDWSKSPRNLRVLSSPLARSWSPFHLMPTESCFATAVHEFDHVINAFSLTGRPLRVLEAGSPTTVPYEIFNRDSCLSHTFRHHSPAAMRYLESLALKINMDHHPAENDFPDPEVDLPDDPEEKTLSVHLLGAALLHMPGLRRPSLSGDIINSSNPLMLISELFSALKLPSLEVLALSGMLGSAADILAFLRAQPRLRELSLSMIELSEGTWANLVDDMQRWLLLESVCLGLPLREDGGIDLWDEIAWRNLYMSDEIESYVLFGGVNPLRVPE